MKRAQLLLLIIFCYLPAAAAPIPEGVDSTLYAYFRRCNDGIREPEVLLTADSLFQLSQQKGDVRMQAASLSFKADYYYFNNNLDSLKVWMGHVQHFARQNNQLKYYYFVWNRLILYYTKHTQYALAQYELKRVLEQSAKDDYKPATAQACQQLGHIYQLKGLVKPAIDYYLKAINYLEHNAQDYYSLGTLYQQLADAYINARELKNATQAIDMAQKHMTQPDDIWDIKLRRSMILAYQGKYAESERLMREIEKNTTSVSREQLLNGWLTLYMQNGSNQEALQTLDQLQEVYRRLGHTEPYYLERFGTRATIYAALEDYPAAYRNLQHYVELLRQRTQNNSQQALDEFATMLDVARLDREKTDLAQQAQNERLRATYFIIAALALILTLAGIFIAILTRMNRHLSRAKHAAEDANRMKGIFIRNITHEINTPLNAIVGFAGLASAAPVEDPERPSYLNIIQQNSGYLQKLVDDVLYISDIESSDSAPTCTPTDIELCCRQSIEAIASPEGPELRLQPHPEALCVITSRQFVVKVLTELLLNASRFAPQGCVTLDYTLTNDRLTFTVTDQGPGIADADAERIFERFVKLNPFSQGLGLGLGVCRLIARSLNGEIRLDTSFSGGARFIFSIPAK